VVCSYLADAKSTLCLRTYRVRSHPPLSISLIDAMMATCTTQPEFTPVSSGKGFKKKEYIAASGAANPIHEVITEAHLLFDGESTVSSLLSLGIGHPGVLSLSSDGKEASLHHLLRDIMNDCEQRAQEAKQRIGRTGIYLRLSVDQGMQDDHSGNFDDQSWIVTQTDSYLNRRGTSEELDQFMQNWASKEALITLDQLKYAGGQTAATTAEKAFEILISNKDDAVIAKLLPPDLDCGPHVNECMDGTRQDILERIERWSHDLDAPNILWIKGYPGVGKSAIAASAVEKYRLSGRLGSSFFFRRERADVLNPNALWRKVAHDFGRRYPDIRKWLVTALSENETIPSMVNTDSLFRQIIQEPLVASGETTSANLPIVIVDALDECGGMDGQRSSQRASLMKTLHNWSHLPTKFKLIVTSRGENDIETLFVKTKHDLIEIITGEKVDIKSSNDIRAFLEYHFQQITAQYPMSLP
ncbi:hypothetical protein M408DRAFT_311277, partial [Serendipita vermifera MAFF 305830]